MPPDRLFAACLRTVTRLNWKIQHTDATTRTLSCAATGKKKRLGGGQDMSLIVEPMHGETSKVALGWAYQAARLFDHGEKKEIGSLFFETLNDVVFKSGAASASAATRMHGRARDLPMPSAARRVGTPALRPQMPRR